VVADTVAAAELAVGVVIGHAPAKGTGHALLGNGIVEDGGVAQSLCQPVRLVVKGLGRELLAPELADEVTLAEVRRNGRPGLAARAPAGVGVIVVGVNILEQLALAGDPHAAGGAGGVQPMDGLVGALVKGLVIGTAVHPHAPQEHAGVIAALADHLAAVLQCLGLPGFIPDVLPAGHLHEHQQAQLIAGIQKSRALGVVAGAHCIAAQLLFQQLGIQLLNAVRHGIALIGVALMPVQAPQLHPLAVQIKAPGHELDGAEAEPGALFVQHSVGQAAGAGPDEPDGQGIEEGVLHAPGVHAVQGAHNGQAELTTVQGSAPGRAADLGLQGAADGLAHCGGIDAEIALGLRLDEDVAQVGRLLHVQTDGPVDAAVGQKIDLPAEGRNVQVLPAVAPDSHHIFLAQQQRFGQVHSKGGVAAPVVEHPPPVAEHGGIVGHGSKGQQYRAALPLFGRKKLPPVAGHPLVFVLVAIVVGQRFDRVGQAHRLQLHPGAFGADDGGIKGGGKQPAVVPIVVFHSLSPSLCTKKFLPLCYHKVVNEKSTPSLIFSVFAEKAVKIKKAPAGQAGAKKKIIRNVGHGGSCLGPGCGG